MAANALFSLQPPPEGDLRALVNFSEKSIQELFPYALPARATVAQVPETLLEPGATLDRLKRMRDDGYRIAIDDFESLPGAEALFALADMLIVDMLDKTPGQLAVLAKHGLAAGKTLLAKRVESSGRFDLARSLGFTLFQGYHFMRPEVIPGRKLTSNELSRFKLLRVIESDEPNYDETVQIIQADVGVSHRLLLYLNSPALGLPTKIASIRQASLLMGWKLLRNWLRLIVLTDMASGDHSRELAFLSLVRARFLEQVAGEADTALPGESCFLLGLFSLLDAMLGLPMAEVMKLLPLNKPIKAALCEGKGALARWLDVVDCFEQARWTELDAVLAQVVASQKLAADSYAQALLWANEFFEQSGPPLGA